jgi:hypothetical protein
MSNGAITTPTPFGRGDYHKDELQKGKNTNMHYLRITGQDPSSTRTARAVKSRLADVLEPIIVPDISDGAAQASLASLRLA